MNMEYNEKSFQLFCGILSQSKYGSISLLYLGKQIFHFKSKKIGPVVKVIIKDLRCIENFFLKGDLGWAESYIDQLWETNDLPAFLEWGARNFHYFSDYIRGKWYVILYLRFKHYINRNSRKGSQQNIKFHYDLGNDFYRSWLDKSMTYSSAIFNNENQSLFDAQINKFKLLSDLCNIEPNDNVLEIGSGWGAFSIFLAKNKEAKITTTTISRKQYEEVRKKIFLEKLEGRVKVLLTDYRDLKGKFDKIVSVEMFEAVGEKYWSLYFNILNKMLKPTGKIGLQTIVIKDNYFKSYKKFPDFIQTHIFPGGMLPSISALNNTVQSNGLKVIKKNFFGEHYVKTLVNWRKSFEASWDEIKLLNFDLNFRRLWRYYLSYCEGGFRSGNINVGQFLISKD